VSLLQVDLNFALKSNSQNHQGNRSCVPFHTDLHTDQSTLVDLACNSLQRPPYTNDTRSFCLCRQKPPRHNISEVIDEYQCPVEPTITRAFAHLDSSNITLNSDFIAKVGGGYLYPLDRTGYGGTMRFDIADHQVDITPKAWYAHWGKTIADTNAGFPRIFLDIAKEVQLPNISFIISMADGSPAHRARKMPWLNISTMNLWTNAVPGPHPYEIAPLGVWRTEGRPGVDLLSLPRSVSDWGRSVRSMFEKRANASFSPTSFAVFRGRDTGLGYRQDVRSFSKRRPDLLDAGVDPLSDEQQMRFKAVVVIDGQSLADRLPRQMAYGVPVVLVHPLESLNEFWYHEMRPWEHYVPASVSDLELTLDTLQKDPHLAREIGLNGKRFIEERLSERRLRCYMYRLLQEYAARFQN